MNKSMDSGADFLGWNTLTGCATHWMCDSEKVASLCFGFLSCKTWIIISTSFRVVRT